VTPVIVQLLEGPDKQLDEKLSEDVCTRWPSCATLELFFFLGQNIKAVTLLFSMFIKEQPIALPHILKFCYHVEFKTPIKGRYCWSHCVRFMAAMTGKIYQEVTFNVKLFIPVFRNTINLVSVDLTQNHALWRSVNNGRTIYMTFINNRNKTH
jgi:hypothetical protein